jgi:hypothetical protein
MGATFRPKTVSSFVNVSYRGLPPFYYCTTRYDRPELPIGSHVIQGHEVVQIELPDWKLQVTPLQAPTPPSTETSPGPLRGFLLFILPPGIYQTPLFRIFSTKCIELFPITRHLHSPSKDLDVNDARFIIIPSIL